MRQRGTHVEGRGQRGWKSRSSDARPPSVGMPRSGGIIIFMIIITIIKLIIIVMMFVLRVVELVLL